MELSTINQIFSGLALEGCWCCLDEFNRIDVSILSVIGNIFNNILVGLKSE